MSDQLQPFQNMAPNARDYTRPQDVAEAIGRLVDGLREDQDDPRMFEMLGAVLDEEPGVVMDVVKGSIELAGQRLGQDRRTGSSATLLYPVDAAMRVVALRRNLIEDPLSANSWNTQLVRDVLAQYRDEVVELAGSNTTSKNLPQRAAHLLWLLDQCPLVQPGQRLALLEIGASGGLLLDALRDPTKFRDWMARQGYQANFAAKANPASPNAVLGLDLVRPDQDWLRAVIPDDGVRAETTQFMRDFDRSPVVVESATELEGSEAVRAFFDANRDAIPIIFSCFVFYQLDDATRERVTQQARAMLRERGGGLLVVSDIAKYRGFPDQAGGCVSWVEDQDGNRVSPAIFLTRSTLTEWQEL